MKLIAAKVRDQWSGCALRMLVPPEGLELTQLDQMPSDINLFGVT
jgi:hypothetical protein